MLGVRKTVENGAMTVAIKGEIDTISSIKLDREIGVVEGLKSVTLDLKEVSYITSAGIRVLLGVGKRVARRGPGAREPPAHGPGDFPPLRSGGPDQVE